MMFSLACWLLGSCALFTGGFVAGAALTNRKWIDMMMEPLPAEAIQYEMCNGELYGGDPRPPRNLHKNCKHDADRSAALS